MVIDMSFLPIITPVPIIDRTPDSLNIGQAIITALFAVASGFILYLLKTWVDEEWIRHRRKYKQLQAETSYLLVKYANVIMYIVAKPDQRHEEASKDIRDLAAKMSAFAIERPKVCPGVPSKVVLKEVYQELIGLSNCMYSSKENLLEHMDHNGKLMKKIRDLLSINLEKGKKDSQQN